MAIARAKEQLKTQLEAAVKKAAQRVVEEKIFNTPVNTGYAVSNWQVSLNTPATEVLEVRDPTGSFALANAINVIDQFTLNDTLYITNNVPYIQRIT